MRKHLATKGKFHKRKKKERNQLDIKPIKDRIYRCVLFLRLLDICLDKLQLIIVANRRTHPNRLEMKGEKYAESNDRSISYHILA